MMRVWDEPSWQAAVERGALRGGLLAMKRGVVAHWEIRHGPMPGDLRAEIERVDDLERLRRVRAALYRGQRLESALRDLTQ